VTGGADADSQAGGLRPQPMIEPIAAVSAFVIAASSFGLVPGV